eukprot:scaffold8070_cov117-Cylindrotheca_fusiformis.AAC.12
MMMKVYCFASTIFAGILLLTVSVKPANAFVNPAAPVAAIRSNSGGGIISDSKQPNTVLFVSSKQEEQQQAQVAGESEAEKMMRKARALRQEAEQDETQVHQHLYEKKAAEDQQLDGWISNLLEHGEGRSATVERLKVKKPSMETMERMIDRLHVRNLIARGHEHVVPGTSTFQRVKRPADENEADRMVSLVESLIDAVRVLDDEKDEKGRPKPHAESQHWGGAEKAKKLNARWHELKRENEEQFLKRQQSFRDAQTIKKDQKAPPKEEQQQQQQQQQQQRLSLIPQDTSIFGELEKEQLH